MLDPGTCPVWLARGQLIIDNLNALGYLLLMHIEIQVHHEDSAFLKTERARDKFTSLFISRMGELVPSANVNLFLTSIMVEPEGDGWHRANKMWVRSDSEDIRESMHVRDMAKRAWMYASNAPGLSR